MIRMSLAAAALAIGAYSPVQAEDYARTAANAGNAILTGDMTTLREMLPPLTETEYAELAKLSGCDALLNRGGGDRVVIVNWVCGEGTDKPGLARTTAMLFHEDGRLWGFSINRMLQDLSSPAAVGKPPDGVEPRAILREFGKAVTDGGDMTLGGRIVLDDFDRARLEPYSKGNFRVSRRNRDGQYRITLYEGGGRFSPRRMALLQYDEQGRPKGLIFTPTFFKRERKMGDSVAGNNTNYQPRARPVATGCVIC
ncbi:hypothetical protein ACI5KX_12035 [Erythrobacter sp. GH1-10]|uniref:hypothetical protein n=1 Tax=Erythrobacter sp. GH1-10 TaxID=3349334 RepID=UPI003877BBC9